MVRPLRIEFPNALYHITSHGDRREDIYDDDTDRGRFLEVLGRVVNDYNWFCHGYCLMSNHYHLIIETPDGNLSKGMRQLNGVYTQASNRRHGRSGHVFQGRYKAILVDKHGYLLELSRYVVLNPVRAKGMVRRAGDWKWSSYRALAGEATAPVWLTTDWLLSQFARTRPVAQRKYRAFVEQGIGESNVWDDLKGQIYLGDDHFVERMQRHINNAKEDLNIPRMQKRPIAQPLEKIETEASDRNNAIQAAYATGLYNQREIGEYFGLHPSTIGVIVRKQADS